MRILCAEDNATNRKVIQLMLEANGHALDFAVNGQEAVILFLENDYSLILMDMEMPIMTGLQATRKIRGLEQRQGRNRTPILFLTGNDDADHIQAGHEAGADGHLVKPFSPETLITAILEATRKAQNAPMPSTDVA
ncbi:MAG: response regulator [Asticcacaulis sp.]